MNHRYIPHGSGFALDTGRVVIGRAYVPPPPRIVSRDAEHLQSALLEPRTKQPQSTIRRVAGYLWSKA
ncbi:hypothetical protein [Hydrogenophaga sp.]|uniref:hypothetical protein n=1 Tax=Hydrogenophaga sp. TaxID=1904254 RepID=UPI002726F2BA|nr:hypothetical protein [Hydrogenophaga sp.]MDO9132002.1 hypothetical protein [Hydrogenophaga sp.]